MQSTGQTETTAAIAGMSEDVPDSDELKAAIAQLQDQFDALPYVKDPPCGSIVFADGSIMHEKFELPSKAGAVAGDTVGKYTTAAITRTDPPYGAVTASNYRRQQALQKLKAVGGGDEKAVKPQFTAVKVVNGTGGIGQSFMMKVEPTVETKASSVGTAADQGDVKAVAVTAPAETKGDKTGRRKPKPLPSSSLARIDYWSDEGFAAWKKLFIDSDHCLVMRPYLYPDLDTAPTKFKKLHHRSKHNGVVFGVERDGSVERWRLTIEDDKIIKTAQFGVTPENCVHAMSSRAEIEVTCRSGTAVDKLESTSTDLFTLEMWIHHDKGGRTDILRLTDKQMRGFLMYMEACLFYPGTRVQTRARFGKPIPEWVRPPGVIDTSDLEYETFPKLSHFEDDDFRPLLFKLFETATELDMWGRDWSMDDVHKILGHERLAWEAKQEDSVPKLAICIGLMRTLSIKGWAAFVKMATA